MVPPAERLALGNTTPLVFKCDLRNYVYDGSVQWVAARLHQGQTTNFRTRGGGFAPVYHSQPEYLEESVPNLEVERGWSEALKLANP